MLLRISLIVALLAGLGVAVVSHLQIAGKITELTGQRDDYKTQMETAQTNEKNTKGQLKTATENLKTANSRLNVVTNELAAVTVKAAQQEKRANEASATLEKTAKERNEAQQELAAWKGTGLTSDQVQAVVDRLKKVEQEKESYVTENDVLNRKILKLNSDLEKYIDPNSEVIMRVGMKGKVLAVDPKWNFVVLDVGAEQGALERGEMLVNRNGKLVAKVRITTVERSRSVANVLPEWRQVDIMEGDQVLY